jgi:hypothetical protein
MRRMGIAVLPAFEQEKRVVAALLLKDVERDVARLFPAGGRIGLHHRQEGFHRTRIERKDVQDMGGGRRVLGDGRAGKGRKLHGGTGGDKKASCHHRRDLRFRILNLELGSASRSRICRAARSDPAIALRRPVMRGIASQGSC